MSRDPTAVSCAGKYPSPRLRSRVLNLLPESLQSLAFGCFLELPTLIFRRRVCELYFGAKISLDLCAFLQRYIYFFGFWEPNISCAVTDMLKSGDVFVDVGAHVGYDTLLAASLVGGSGSVYSFEADPNTYAFLAAHIDINKLTNVIAMNVAVTNQRGSVDLFRPNQNNSGQNSIICGRDMQKVATVRGGPIDAFIPEGDRLRVRLIKIDVEGAEQAVLSGILSDVTLLRNQPDFIVEISNPRQFWGSEVMRSLKSYGYKPYSINNDYSLRFYLEWSRPATPTLLARPPRAQTDVLFSSTWGSRLAPQSRSPASLSP